MEIEDLLAWKLFQDTGDQSFAYFDAVILSNEISEKEIKINGISLQHGQEGKVDYNPIEKLVECYRDIIKDKLFDVKEYAKSIDTKESDVEKSVQLAGLMEDFLEYINAPEQFYIARELEIDGPLNEIYNIKKELVQMKKNGRKLELPYMIICLWKLTIKRKWRYHKNHSWLWKESRWKWWDIWYIFWKARRIF